MGISEFRFVAYSTTSMNALAYGNSTEAARALACDQHRIDDECLVVFCTRSRDSIDRYDGGRWPKDSRIVWRGSNDLAQRYRRSRATKTNAQFHKRLTGETVPEFTNNPNCHAHCEAEWEACRAGRPYEVVPRGWQPLAPRPGGAEPDDE